MAQKGTDDADAAGGADGGEGVMGRGGWPGWMDGGRRQPYKSRPLSCPVARSLPSVFFRADVNIMPSASAFSTNAHEHRQVKERESGLRTRD